MLDRTAGYTSYRTTNVLWAESLPSSWEELRLKAFADFVNRGSTPDYVDESRYRVVNQATFSKGRFDESEIRFTNDNSGDARGALEVGDVLLASTGGGVLGKCHLFLGERGKYIADSHVTIIRDKRGRFVPAFLYYCLLINYDFIEGTLGQGATNQTELQRSWLRDTVFPFPDLETQVRIVSFLDEKTAEIDAAVEKKRRLIDLLNEQKSILINRAVTNGLNPDATMKDSGVDWIGEIPAHWDVKRAKYVFDEIDQRSATGEEELLSVSHTTGVTPRSEKNIMMFMAEDYTGSKLCQPSDVVFNIMWAWMGALGVSEHDGIVSPSYGVFRSKEPYAFNNWYLENLLRSWGYVQEYNRRSTGLHSSRLRLYAHMFFAMEIGFPSRAEQNEIERETKDRLELFDQSIDATEREITTLNEFKQTLIANAVTGKIKI